MKKLSLLTLLCMSVGLLSMGCGAKSTPPDTTKNMPSMKAENKAMTLPPPPADGKAPGQQ